MNISTHHVQKIEVGPIEDLQPGSKTKTRDIIIYSEHAGTGEKMRYEIVLFSDDASKLILL